MALFLGWWGLAFVLFFIMRNLLLDIVTHNEAALAMLNGEADWPPNFLYYAILSHLAWLTDSTHDMGLSSSILLSLAVGAKAWMTFVILCRLAPSASLGVILLVAASLPLALPIPLGLLIGSVEHILPGQLPPNIWHNSTTIFLMPIALATFLLQADAFRRGHAAHLWALTGLVLVGVLIKPSFFFAYAPATALWLLVRIRRFERPLMASLPLILGAALTASLYVLIYTYELGSFQSEDSSVVIRPFFVWLQSMPALGIPFALLVSFAVPVLYAASGRAHPISAELGFAVLLMGAALIWYVFVSEAGPRATHGNFFWQTVVCCYLLYAVVLGEMLERDSSRSYWLISGWVAYAIMPLIGSFYLWTLVDKALNG